MAIMVKEARLEAIWFNKEITILLRGKLSTRPFSADRVPSIHLHPAKHLHYLHNGARNDSVFKRLPDLFVQCRAYRCFGSVVGDRTIPPEHSRGCCLPTKHSRKVRAAPALNRWCSRWGIHCLERYEIQQPRLQFWWLLLLRQTSYIYDINKIFHGRRWCRWWFKRFRRCAMTQTVGTAIAIKYTPEYFLDEIIQLSLLLRFLSESSTLIVSLFVSSVRDYFSLSLQLISFLLNYWSFLILSFDF